MYNDCVGLPSRDNVATGQIGLLLLSHTLYPLFSITGSSLGQFQEVRRGRKVLSLVILVRRADYEETAALQPRCEEKFNACEDYTIIKGSKLKCFNIARSKPRHEE